MATADPPSSGSNRRLVNRLAARRQQLNAQNSQVEALPPRKLGAASPEMESIGTQKHSRSPKFKPQTARTIHFSPFRLLLVWAILTVSGLALGWNLYGLQIVRGPMLRSQARNQQMVSMRPFVPRRPIVDRNGTVLAIDRPTYALYAHPKLFKIPPEAVAKTVAKEIGRQPDALIKQFNTAQSGIRLENALLEEVADRVAALRLDGLELVKQYSRLYPQDDLAADVVGYVNIDHKGQAGVEYSQEKLLERFVRSVRLTRSGNGTLMPDRVPSGLLNFDDLRLHLTIDSSLQRSARLALKEQIKYFKAKRGTIMVMDVRDGSLLALVSEPSYNPNQYYKFDVGLFKNWALTDQYEPGSTFKPINIAIALEAGVIQPDSKFKDEGQIRVGVELISNHDFKEKGRRGLLTVTQILQDSSNVGMVHIIQKMRPTVYYGWLERLGIGQTVEETGLPFTAPGYLNSQEEFTASPIYAATASFGQGFSLTPIQLLQLHGALANGGQLVTPHIVRGLSDSKGQIQWQPTLPAPRPLFSKSTTQTVLSMMEAVVTEGTGMAARISGYRIAGKTGTSQKASPTGGYSKSAKITSFVSILPVESPRYVVLAVIDEPQGRVFGSTVAAPVVKSVMETLMTMEQLPPSSSKK